MSNYKIKVNNESESGEAQELFKQIGCGVVNHIYNEKGFIVASKGATNPLNFDYWCIVENEITLPQLRDLVAQSKNEQGLISGVDALRALADGDYVEYWCEDLEQWVFMDMQNHFKRKFRLKPRTITLNVEIPAPFEPKDGDFCFVFDNENEDGFLSFDYSSTSGFHNNLIQFGAWRTEEEIKQVVAALLGVLK